MDSKTQAETNINANANKQTKTTLIIMAAGIGSRFGGSGKDGRRLKQLSAIDDYDNIIMDYSVYDAVAAGFEHIVFVIRKDTFEAFKEVIGNRIEKALAGKGIRVSYVFQELDDLPEGISLPADRTKPWGTGQAVLCAKDVVDGPFVIINADDYYGKNCYVKLHQWLVEHSSECPGKTDVAEQDGAEQAELKTGTDKFTMAMAGFVLKNTVSENGTVTRGICLVDPDSMLTEIFETKGIRIDKGEDSEGIAHCDDPYVQTFISPESTVSMNMWAGYPEFLDYLEDGFKRFLLDESGDVLKKEYLIPVIVGELLKEDMATVEILSTDDKWIGITYRDDLSGARAAFKQMIEDGVYPRELWALFPR